MQPSPDQFLTLHPVFCRKDLAEVLRKRNGKASPNTINAHLVRWMKQGRVVQVKKGVYVHSAGAGRSDKFALASRLAPDALLSHHTALELNGVAQSAFNRVTFVTLSCVKPIRFEECQYEPIRPRPSLCLEKYQTRWIESALRENIEIHYTSPERTLVDVFDRPELAGGLEEVWHSAMALNGLRLKELEQYLNLLNRATVAARVGFYLEKRKEELAVPETFLKRLEKLRPSSKVYFLRSERTQGKLMARWNLVVPVGLLDDSWEGL